MAVKKSMLALQELVPRFAGARVLVVGDIIVDHFLWGDLSHLAEAPVPVVNVRRENLLLGGSANVLRNIVSLGGKGALCGMIGGDAMGRVAVGLVRRWVPPAKGWCRASGPPPSRPGWWPRDSRSSALIANRPALRKGGPGWPDWISGPTFGRVRCGHCFRLRQGRGRGRIDGSAAAYSTGSGRRKRNGCR